MSDVKPEEKKAETKTVEAAAPVAEKKSGSKLPLILIILVLIVVVCAACGFGGWYLVTNVINKTASTLNNIVQDNFPGVNNTTGTNGNNTVTNGTTNGGTYTTNDGSVSFGGTLPSGFPSDVPIYSNSTVAFSTSAPNSKGSTDYTVMFSVKAASADIISYYRNYLTNNGWNVAGEQSIFGASITANKGTREITVLAFDASDGTGDASYTLSITEP